MRYRIEVQFAYGWDDAGWTEEKDGAVKPTRFRTIREAQAALDEFFDDVKVAVFAGNIDVEEFREDYRIVGVRKRTGTRKPK